MPTTPATTDDVLASLRRLSLALERWRPAFARQHGLAENDSLVLSLLLTAPDRRLLPRELCEHLGILTGTLTPMLDRLERAALVTRSPNPRDRRSVFVNLTDLGAAAFAECQQHVSATIARAVPAAQRRDFVRRLDALAGAVAESADTLG